MIYNKEKKTFNAGNIHQGFTLIETFVAITVLMIAVMGPMTLLSKALQDSAYIRDEIVATFLAQEGVELMIDNRNNESGSQLSIGVVSDNRYTCNQFYLGLDGYSCNPVGRPTNFSRTVTVEQETGFSTDEFRVVSRVNKLHGQPVISSGIIFKASGS